MAFSIHCIIRLVILRILCIVAQLIQRIRYPYSKPTSSCMLKLDKLISNKKKVQVLDSSIVQTTPRSSLESSIKSSHLAQNESRIHGRIGVETEPNNRNGKNVNHKNVKRKTEATSKKLLKVKSPDAPQSSIHHRFPAPTSCFP